MENPIEKIIEQYKTSVLSLRTNRQMGVDDLYDRGWTSALQYALEELGVDTKEIRKNLKPQDND